MFLVFFPLIQLENIGRSIDISKASSITLLPSSSTSSNPDWDRCSDNRVTQNNYLIFVRFLTNLSLNLYILMCITYFCNIDMSWFELILKVWFFFFSIFHVCFYSTQFLFLFLEKFAFFSITVLLCILKVSRDFR